MIPAHDPQTVLDFWFPDDGHWTSIESHAAFWEYRMQGGVDDAILRDFGPITEAAARGDLDHWAENVARTARASDRAGPVPALLLAGYAGGLCAGHQGEPAGFGGAAETAITTR